MTLATACRIPDENLRVRDGAGDDDADLGPCNQAAPWGPLVAVPGLPAMRSVARFTSDELNAYIALGPDGMQASTPDTLFVASRATVTENFGMPMMLLGPNDPNGQTTPSVSPDGSTIIYTWGQPPVHPMGIDRDIYRATRTGGITEYSTGEKLAINADNFEDDFSFLTPNGDIWFSSKRGTDSVVSIYKALSVGGGAFATPVYASDLNSTVTANDFPLVTNDNLHVFFQRDSTMFFASRTSVDGSFGTPDTVDEINNDPNCAGTNCRPSWISPDACRLYVGIGDSGQANVTMFVSTKPAN
jgi:hypothetical protein